MVSVAALLAVAMSGCRQSEVLEQIIMTEEAVETADASRYEDSEQGEVENSRENIETEEDLDEVSGQQGDSDADAETGQGASYDGEAGAAEGGVGTASGSAGVTPSTDGREAGDDAESENADGDTSPEAPDAAEDPEDPSDPGAADTPVNPEETEPDEDADASNDDGNSPSDDQDPGDEEKPKKTVTDGNGEEQEIPEDVHTVTAVGDAAVIVEMLGGSGRIAGANADFLSNSLSQALFDDLGGINSWWDGDGSGTISDGNFAALLAAAPDVCFEISGQSTFSSDQITQLKAAGIGYMALPTLTDSESIKSAVNIVADVLDVSTGGQDAKKTAAEYSDWVDNLHAEVRGAVGDVPCYSTLYISEWREVGFHRMYEPAYGTTPQTTYDPSAVNGVLDFPEETDYMHGSAGYGIGVAVTWGWLHDEALTSELAIADIFQMGKHTYNTVNRASDYLGSGGELTQNMEEAYVFPYQYRFGYPVYDYGYVPLYCLDMDGLSSRSDFVETKGNDGFNGVTGLNVPGAVHGTEEYMMENKIPYKPQDVSACMNLGDEYYPAIIAADEATAASIAGHNQWRAGYLKDAAEEARCSKYGVSWYRYLIDSYDIEDTYTILVMPYGLSNWAEGGVESPLASYWGACRISGRVSEEDLVSKVCSFYKTFFQKDIDSSMARGILKLDGDTVMESLW